jgi:MFS family permease
MMRDRRVRVLLLTGSGAFSIGQGLYGTLAIVYALNVVHVSTTGVGTAFSAAGVAGLIAILPAGYVADSFNIKATAVVVSGLLAVTLALLALARDFPSLVLVVCLITILEKGNSVIRQTMISHLVSSQHRVRAQAEIRTAFNAGFAIGAAATAPVLATSSPAAFRLTLAAAAALYLVTCAVSALLPHTPNPRRESLPRAFVAIKDRRFVTISLVNSVLSLHISLLEVAIPLWVVTRTSVSGSLVGVLIVINTVLTIGLQVPLSKGSETVAGGRRALVRSSVMGFVATVLFGVSGIPDGVGLEIGLLVAGVGVLTACEVIQSAGSWGVSFGLSPIEHRGRYLAVFAYGSAIQGAVGPVLVSVLFVLFGGVGWVLLGAVMLLGGLAMRWVIPAAQPPAAEPVAR